MSRSKLVRLVALAIACGALLLSVAGAAASDTTTVHFHKQVDASVDDTGSDCGLTGFATSTYNGVLSVTTNADGSSDTHGTFTGEIVFDPFDPTLPTYSGHFTQRFSQRNSGNELIAFEFASNLRGDDGSTLRIHETMHYSVSANGNVVSFDKPRCAS
jgi:hypothetical protein